MIVVTVIVIVVLSVLVVMLLIDYYRSIIKSTFVLGGDREAEVVADGESVGAVLGIREVIGVLSVVSVDQLNEEGSIGSDLQQVVGSPVVRLSLTGGAVDQIASGGGVQVSSSGEVAEVDLDEESAIIDAVNTSQLGEGLLDVGSWGGGWDSLEFDNVEGHLGRVEQDGVLSSSSSLLGGDDDVLVSAELMGSPDEESSGWVEVGAWGSVDDGVSDRSWSGLILVNEGGVSGEVEGRVHEDGTSWWKSVQGDGSLVSAGNDFVENSDLSPLGVVQANQGSVLRIDESLSGVGNPESLLGVGSGVGEGDGLLTPVASRLFGMLGVVGWHGAVGSVFQGSYGFQQPELKDITFRGSQASYLEAQRWGVLVLGTDTNGDGG